MTNLQEQPYQIKEITYRPFDKRFIWWETDLIERAREKIMELFDNKNIAMLIGRAGQNVPEAAWNLCFITKFISDINLCYRGGATVFPLYYYNGNGKSADDQYLFADENGKKSNFTPQFKEFIGRYYPDRHLEAREIFDYLYAILHAPTYREKYKDFLQIDFPKVPFVANLTTFLTLSKLGHELSEAHLIESGAWESLDAGMLMEIGSNQVKEIKFQDNRLYYNEKQYFDKVSPDVWAFQIGGYQVLEKYFKDRKGKNISEELTHIENIIKILTFSLQKMQEIDQEIKVLL